MKKQLKNSDQYLTNKIGNSHGFKVSDDYFNTIEDAVFAKLATEKFNEKSGFKTPNNYFDGVESVVLSKIPSNDNETKVIPLRTKIARFASIAAAACVLLFVGFQLYYATEQNSLDAIPVSEVENWMNNNISQIENEDLLSVLNTTDFETNQLLTSSLSADAIENYLNTIDTSPIINEIN